MSVLFLSRKGDERFWNNPSSPSLSVVILFVGGLFSPISVKMGPSEGWSHIQAPLTPPRSALIFSRYDTVQKRGREVSFPAIGQSKHLCTLLGLGYLVGNVEGGRENEWTFFVYEATKVCFDTASFPRRSLSLDCFGLWVGVGSCACIGC